MGKANQQRRRMKAKARKKAPSSGSHGTWWTSGEQPTLEESAVRAVLAAMDALARSDRPSFERAAATVSERPGVVGWRRTIERLLTAYLQSAVSGAWRRGWQPADLDRVVGRTTSTRHVGLIRDAIALELRGYAVATIDPQWTAQLADLEVEVWWPPDQTYLRARAEEPKADWTTVVPRALEVLDLVLGLPALEILGPIPGTARPSSQTSQRAGIDERVLSRVRALLAKAESTTFPAEAETFTAGAQALMARHSIDVALLAAHEHDTQQKPIGRRIPIDNPYEAPKAMLLEAVARANRCRVVWSRSLGHCTTLGYPADLDAVEMLFTSLLVQATSKMTQAGSRSDRYGRSRTRAFRQSFLTSYASRIDERLAEATQTQTAQAATEPAGRNLLPVLAARDHAVEETVAAMFPNMTHARVGAVTDSEGWHSGRSAADLAALRTGAELAG